MSELRRGTLGDDRYVVEGLLGGGGMAAVYLARHTRLGSYHAIKVVELDRPSVRRRLVREGTIQSKLKHGNIDALAAGRFDGLEAAHALDVVHRDLKPHNVILEVSGAFTSDGSAMEGGRRAGLADLSPLSPILAGSSDPTAICRVLTKFTVTCLPCPNGGSTTCAQIEVDSITWCRRDPRSGDENSGGRRR